jgi:hypothetical protein
MRHEIPRKERDPIRNVARLVFVGAVYKSRLELVAQFTKVVVHETFQLEGALVIVELLDRAEVRRVPGVATGAEHVGDEMAVLKGVVDAVRIRQYWFTYCDRNSCMLQ